VEPLLAICIPLFDLWPNIIAGPILMGQVIVVVLLKKVYIMITREFWGLTSWESYVITKNKRGCLSSMYATMKSQESKPAVYRVLNILRIIGE